MPYSINPSGSEFEVVNDDTREVMGKHPTRRQAIEQQKALYANVPDAAAKEAALERPGLIDRVANLLRDLKEGRRNASGDLDRLQQIHDLAVANGAQCEPLVFKEAGGRLRWVMLSSNSFEDRDREVVSQQAHEQDTDRMMTTKNFGPLRWWHVGNPDTKTLSPGEGIDIGDCDFSVMHGRINVESGTFRDERIGEAIKQHADTLEGSKGFFHPLTQPNSEGVFDEIYTFERSLLPRGRASNPLTALTVTKEQDMATMKEKYDEFVSLLGGDKSLAESVVKRAEQTEKEAQLAGIRAKENGAEVQPDDKKPEGEEAIGAVPDKAEPEVKAEGEPPHDDAAVDAALLEKLLPAIMEKVNAAIDEKLAGATKERAEKEAGLNSLIDALSKGLKETQTVVNTLNGDLPRGVKDGFRASQADSTIDTQKPTIDTAKESNPIGNIYNWLVQPVQG